MDVKTHLAQMKKFIIVGFGSAVINYGTFFILLKLLHVYYLAASACGFLTGLFFSYAFNRLWTFDSKNEKKLREFFLYALVCIVSLAIALGALKFQVSILRFNPLFANAISIGISATLNFIGLKLFVFKPI